MEGGYLAAATRCGAGAWSFPPAVRRQLAAPLPPAYARAAMLYLIIKALISGILIAVPSTLAKRYPGFGALIASLPLVSVLGMN